MEPRMAPAPAPSPPLPPPPKHFRPNSTATSPYATAPSSPRGRLLVPSDGLFLTAPPSPNPFDDDLLLPPAATPRLTAPNPFDLFQHFTSAPASPRRAAAIYAHFADGDGGRRDGGDDSDGDEEEEEFQPRRSYATGGGSSVPFEWEERPGTPKRGLGGGAATNVAAAWDTEEFEFGTQVGGAAPVETLTTADELFEKGRIRPLMKPNKAAAADEPKMRPLKPPPGLLDGGGSVASSPRSPMMATMKSPRRRSRVSSGVDFDPFAAALLEATKAPSPLGGGGKGGSFGPGSPAKKPAPWSAAGWRKWRLSDLLLFRSSSDGGGRVGDKQDPDVKVKPVQQLDVPAVKKAAMTIKAGAKGKGGDGMGKDWRKHHGNRNNAAAAAESVAGCARLSPLQRLARGLGAHTWNYRGMAAPGNKG